MAETYITQITDKNFRIYIDKKVRDKLGLEYNDYVKVTIEKVEL